jgi:osmoprotectant transport system permease protein
VQDSKLLLRALKQHLILSFTALFIAIVIGISLGVYISYNPFAARVILAIGSITQVIPSLALLALLIPIFGLGFKPALVALSIYALLPIVQNTYSGISSIAPEYMDLAQSLALKPWIIVSRVQLPMALATIIAGIRTSSVICIGAATLATFVGAGGLGDLIKAGIDLNSNYMIALGAVPAALLALSVSYALSLVEKRLD